MSNDPLSKPKRYLFIGLITFGLGFRGLHFGDFALYPAQVLFWFLTVILFRFPQRQFLTHWSLPKGWRLFFIFATIALISGIALGSTSFGIVLMRYFTWLTVIPVLFVTHQLLTSWEDFRNASWFLIFTSFYVALLGVMEYFVPALFEPFRDTFWSSTSTQVTSGGFVRVPFSIWGNPIAANFLIWMLPFTWYFVFEHPERRTALKLIGMISFIISFSSIYLSGNRSAWLLTVIVVFAYTALQRKKVSILAILIVAIFVFLNLPDTIIKHLYHETIVTPDSSIIIRQKLWSRAWNLLSQNPLGNGWGSGYLVHNDFMQIATDVGLPAMIIVLGIFWRVLRDIRHMSIYALDTNFAGFSRVLFITLLAMIGSMQVHPILEIPILAVPVWFIYSLAVRVSLSNR